MAQYHHHVAEGAGRPDQILPLAEAVTASSATYSLSTVSRGFLDVGAHSGAHLAGPDDENANAVLAQCFSQAEVEAVEPGLGGAVDEVGPPDAFACRGAHRDDLPGALGAHLVAEQHADRHRGGVVDVGDLDGFALILPEFLGVAEQPERDNRDVDITVRPGLLDDSGVAVGVDGVEVDDLHGLRACLLHLGLRGGAQGSPGMQARITRALALRR